MVFQCLSYLIYRLLIFVVFARVNEASPRFPSTYDDFRVNYFFLIFKKFRSRIFQSLE